MPGRPENDQSYMLCLVTRGQAERLVLPLGGYVKGEVRALAEDFGLPQAKKPDSMEICFIPDGDFAAWIARRGRAPGPGALIYRGERVGTHEGYHRYTLGQRRGLGFAAGRRVFVSEIRPETNEVVLSDGEGLYSGRVLVLEASWLVPPPEGEFACLAPRAPLARPLRRAGLRPARRRAGHPLRFPRPRPAPGQAAALYCGERLIAGGIISKCE